LTDENLCSIYENRPKECRVDAMQPTALTQQAWFAMNEGACKKLHLAVYGAEMEVR